MGILGFGLFGEGLLWPAFQKCQRAECVAITKRDSKSAQQKANELGIPHGVGYANLDEFFAIPELEAVFIATPNSMHLADCLASFKAEKHVLLEKPMAMNSRECEQIISTARASECKLMIAHCLRYNTTVNYVRDLVDSGALGKLVTCTADFTSNAMQSSRPWKLDKKLAGGGAAFDLGVHMIDTLRYLIDERIVETRYLRNPRNLQKKDVDFVSSFLVQFESGVIGRVNSTYIGSRNTYLEVTGENGYIRAFDWQPNSARVRIEQEINGEFERTIVDNEDMYVKEIDDFADAILNDSPIPIPGQTGLENQWIIDLANRG